MKYTLKGSEKLDQKINEDLNLIVQKIESIGDFWEGIVLLGGYGRGEGTPLIKGKEQLPYNDYDIIVIAKPLNVFKKWLLQKKLKELILSIPIHVDLFLHTPASLKKGEPSLLNYELLHGHRVLKGPSDILSRYMPKITLEDIPLSEGTRLLLNRGALLLEKRNLFKAYLAMGDSLLLALGKYELLYKNKKITMEQLQGFDWIKTHYLQAVSFKEWGEESPQSDADFEEAIRHFISYFIWYEERRLQIKIRSISDYVKGLEKIDRSLFKNILLNLYYFGMNGFRPNPKWILIYPRVRLYLALLQLLRKERDPLLIGENSFQRLRERFS